MARGDSKLFAAFDLTIKSGVAPTLATDVLKMGIVTSATVPTVATADPRWGTGGSINFASNQVALATSYPGPITLSGVTWTRTSGVNKLDFNDVTVALDASGFSNAAYAIVYDDTLSGKYCIGFIDLGGPVSIVGGALNITINAGGFATFTAT